MNYLVRWIGQTPMRQKFALLHLTRPAHVLQAREVLLEETAAGVAARVVQCVEDLQFGRAFAVASHAGNVQNVRACISLPNS